MVAEMVFSQDRNPICDIYGTDVTNDLGYLIEAREYSSIYFLFVIYAFPRRGLPFHLTTFGIHFAT